MDINDFIESNKSLLQYCKDNNISYSRFYKLIKKTNPNILSRKNNGGSSKKFNPTRDELYDLYVNQGLSQEDIGKLYGVNKSSICLRLKSLNIDTKSISQSRYWTDEKREYYKKLSNTGVIGVYRQSNWKYHTTSIEIKFMEVCNQYGIKFKRQYPIEKYGHQYDFYLPDMNLLVEMDGEYFHNMEKQKIKDIQQVDRSIELGYNIIRITDKELKNDPFVIINKLREYGPIDTL